MAESSDESGKAVVRVGGAAVGGYLSTLIGPEAGAATGQALMEGTDWFISFLSDRARRRVQGVSELTREEVERRLAAGDSLRTDGLLDFDSAAGADVVEGVLRAALEAEGDRKCAGAHL